MLRAVARMSGLGSVTDRTRFELFTIYRNFRSLKSQLLLSFRVRRPPHLTHVTNLPTTAAHSLGMNTSFKEISVTEFVADDRVPPAVADAFRETLSAFEDAERAGATRLAFDRARGIVGAVQQRADALGVRLAVEAIQVRWARATQATVFASGDGLAIGTITDVDGAELAGNDDDSDAIAAINRVLAKVTETTVFEQDRPGAHFLDVSAPFDPALVSPGSVFGFDLLDSKTRRHVLESVSAAAANGYNPAGSRGDAKSSQASNIATRSTQGVTR